MWKTHYEKWLGNSPGMLSPERDEQQVKIVIDTDIGSDVDDSWAIGLALASPEVQLAGVTTCGYNPLVRARIAKKLLVLAGHGDVPVFLGSGSPIKQLADQSPWSRLWGGFPRFFTEGRVLRSMKQEMGYLKRGQRSDKQQVRIEREHAVDALIRLFQEEDNLELVCIGPLTNVARAIEKSPAFVKTVRKITIMGGYLGQLEGFPEIKCGEKMMNPGQDYNLQIDSAAAMIVLNSGIPITLIPADVTLKSWLSPEDLKRFNRLESPFLRPIVKHSKLWGKMQALLLSSNTRDNAGFLHDPLTLAASFNASFCTFKEIAIETYLKRGELRFRRTEAGQRFCCAIKIHSQGFHDFFMNRLLFFSLHHLSCVAGINVFEIQRTAAESDLEGFRNKYNRMYTRFGPVMAE
ncbi:nucleoside hydrolase [Thermodesulfobacteriota bacterium]